MKTGNWSRLQKKNLVNDILLRKRQARMSDSPAIIFRFVNRSIPSNVIKKYRPVKNVTKESLWLVYTVMVSMSGGAWSEISRGAAVKHFVVTALWYFLRGAALTFLWGYLDITWHLLESCFTAFLRRAAFTAYFEAAFFAAFFRGSCFVAFFGGGCFAAFFRGGCFATFLEREPGATAPLAPYKNHHWVYSIEKRNLHEKGLTQEQKLLL